MFAPMLRYPSQVPVGARRCSFLLFAHGVLGQGQLKGPFVATSGRVSDTGKSFEVLNNGTGLLEQIQFW